MSNVILPKFIYRFNATPIKFQLVTLLIKFTQQPQIANSILKETNKVGKLSLPDFKTYYKAIVIETIWYQEKNRQIGEWNRRENPEIGPHKYSQLIFDKEAKVI